VAAAASVVAVVAADGASSVGFSSSLSSIEFGL